MNPSSRTGRVAAPVQERSIRWRTRRPTPSPSIRTRWWRTSSSTRLQLARTIDAIADRVSPQKNLSRALEQVRQRASRVDPLIVGAAAGAVLVSVTVVFLVRRRKR